jgi:enterobactin synthetase component D
MNNIYIYSCDFDIAHYKKSLYFKFDIELPESIKQSVAKRQAEFLAGRYVAKKAITNSILWKKIIPTISIGQHRNPIWPKGIIGSISHNSSKAICAITAKDKRNFIGIDLENYLSEDMALEIDDLLLSFDEKILLLKLNIPYQIAVTLVFSAKESLFKALYPFVNEYFGFECAQITEVSLIGGWLNISLASDIRKGANLKPYYRCMFTFKSGYLQTIIS